MNLIIDVQVKDLDRAVKFYTDVLGLPCRIQADDWAWRSVCLVFGGCTNQSRALVKDF